MENTNILESTAYHESGHAVIAIKEGIGGVQASIKPDETTLGRVNHDTPLKGVQPLDCIVDLSRSEREQIESLVRVYLAGSIAEEIFNPIRFSKFEYQSHADYHSALNLLQHLVGTDEELDAYINLLHIQTKQALSDPDIWIIVQTLANELLKKESLTENEIKQIYDRLDYH